MEVTGRREMVGRKVLVLAIAVFLAASLFTPTARASVLLDQVLELPPSSFQVITLDAEDGTEVEVSLAVVRGGTIDVFLFDAPGLERYRRALQGLVADVTPILEGTALGVQFVRYVFTFPASGVFHVVVDNTPVTGDDSGGDPVAVRAILETPEGAEVLPALRLASGVFFLLLLLFAGIIVLLAWKVERLRRTTKVRMPLPPPPEDLHLVPPPPLPPS
jgi:hypothetical protein